MGTTSFVSDADSPMLRRPLHVRRLGEMDYDDAHDLQSELLQQRIAGQIPDTLLLLEHPPVITLGRAAKQTHILRPASELAANAVPIREIGRGGDVTYHGPGQLVVYPIIDLKPDRKDVRRYVWSLEEIMIRVASRYGLQAGREAGLNGAWIGTNKLGAVGVRIRQWVTMHGFALNVCTDLSHFSWIVPCGIQDRGVTSLSTETGRTVDLKTVEGQVVEEVCALWGYTTETDPASDT